MKLESPIQCLALIRDPRFFAHRASLVEALTANEAQLGESYREMPAAELLSIYQGRLERAQQFGGMVQELAALVDLLGENPSTSWRIFPITIGPVAGAIFVSGDERVGCIARDPDRKDLE